MRVGGQMVFSLMTTLKNKLNSVTNISIIERTMTLSLPLCFLLIDVFYLLKDLFNTILTCRVYPITEHV